MDFTKIYRSKKILIILFLGLFVCCSTKAAEWQTFTSFKEAREFRIFNDTLYAVTSGGILAITDHVVSGLTYNNQDGLGTNDLTDIIEDGINQKWVTGHGRLIKFSHNDSKQYLFFDNDGKLFPLYTLSDDGDFLWIGTDIGLVLFSKITDGGQIQDSYQLFGSLNPAPAVNDLLITGDSIWLATSNGIAVADKTDPVRLKSPSNWTTYDLGTNPELESNRIMSVVEKNNKKYFASGSEVFRFDDTLFVPYNIGSSVKVNKMSIDNDTIFVYYSQYNIGMAAYLDADSLVFLNTAEIDSSIHCGINYKGVRWFGAEKIYYFGQDEYNAYPYTGLPGNDIYDITINSEGTITAAFQGVSAAALVDSTWMQYDFWFRSGLTKIINAPDGTPIMGTAGNGLWVLENGVKVNYDETNSTLRGNSDLPPFGLEFVVIQDMVSDGNFLYAVCYRAVNNYPVAIGDLNNLSDPSRWDSIGVANGLTDIFVVSVDKMDRRLVVGSESDGVFLCDVGDDPFNTDISCRHFLRENSLLISNSVRVVRFSPDGSFWAGTNFGLSRFDDGIERFRDIALPEEISSDITTLEFDGRGNLWIGTKDGLAFLDAVSGFFDVFNSFNSDLPSDLIREIKVDVYTGNTYIATDAGFTVIPSKYGKPVYDVIQVNAFPNPFVINDESDLLNFNFGADGIVNIFNASGERIIELSVNRSWNGKNQDGQDVASGVYIFILKDINGNIGKGKFVLVRNK